MHTTRTERATRATCLWTTLSLVGALACTPVAAQDAGALRAKHATLSDRLATSAFGRPLVIASSETSDGLQGDVHAIALQPFATVAPALQGMDRWCDILMLHLNVKNCTWKASDHTMTVALGRKFDQPLEDTYQVAFRYRVEENTPDYLRVVLDADTGPFGTKNYRIALEATPGEAQTTFVHLAYSYGYGMAARIALQGYLATLGRDKVGFSVSGKDADGTPQYQGGLRSVIERNAMRYYLAIDAYLDALATPQAGRPEKRIRAWFDSTERYPQQLHEMTRDEYLSMKRKELARQNASLAGAT